MYEKIVEFSNKIGIPLSVYSSVVLKRRKNFIYNIDSFDKFHGEIDIFEHLPTYLLTKRSIINPENKVPNKKCLLFFPQILLERVFLNSDSKKASTYLISNYEKYYINNGWSPKTHPYYPNYLKTQIFSFFVCLKIISKNFKIFVPKFLKYLFIHFLHVPHYFLFGLVNSKGCNEEYLQFLEKHSIREVIYYFLSNCNQNELLPKQANFKDFSVIIYSLYYKIIIKIFKNRF